MRRPPSTLPRGGDTGTTACATARALTIPTTSSVPTGSPAWGAISRIRRPVTALSAERGVSEVELVEPRSSRVPQSASGTWTFGLAATGVPSTTRPVIEEVPTSPVAPAEPAAAPARTLTDSATTSPPNAETASALTEPSAEDEVPCCAVAVAVEVPTRSTDPSGGKANDPPPVAWGGAVISPLPPDVPPGTVTCATEAVARDWPAVGSPGAAAAMPTTPTASASTAMSAGSPHGGSG